MRTVSVVVPVYNEELIVGELLARLQKATSGLSYRFDFLVVDDGSTDETTAKLLDLQLTEPRLSIIKLSRNWGHQNAYNAGLDEARADAVILMDGDLEDPPELIPRFLEKWEQGYQVVYGVKQSRKGKWLNRLLFSLFYKMLRVLTNTDIEKQSGMFSLIDGKVADELRRCKERNKYYVGLRSFMGYRQIGLPYDRQERFAGTPKQSFYRLVHYALNAYFSFSFLPIRMVTYFGLFFLCLLTISGVVLIAGRMLDIPLKFFEGVKSVPGWTTLVLLVLFLIGMQIVFIGILGEYVARIFDEVRNRPYYIVENVYRSGLTDAPERARIQAASSTK